MICTLFISRKCGIVMEMTTNGTVSNGIAFTASNEKQYTSSSSAVLVMVLRVYASSEFVFVNGAVFA